MNSQRPKEGTRYRVGLDFHTVEDAVGFVRTIEELGLFGDRDAGARLADGLDDHKVREILVRSIDDVEGHPGALHPLPERNDGESPTNYRKRLGHEQRAIFDEIGALNIR